MGVRMLMFRVQRLYIAHGIMTHNRTSARMFRFCSVVVIA